MRKLLGLALLLLFVFGYAVTGSATILFSDNFDTESSSTVLNYNSFANWTVSNGTVDLVKSGDYGLVGNGFFVDMDGSTGDAGKITSDTFNFLANTLYTLYFDLAGNGRNSNYDSVDVSVAFASNRQTLSGNADWETKYISIWSSSDFSGTISFEGLGGDNVGLLLDNVRVEYNAVPEPATLLLLGAGLIGLAGYGRKKLN